ncbi:MAG: ATP-binding protein [Sedimentisphaerales bacterium]
MERVRNIKIRTRLFIGFGFVVLATLIVTRGFQYSLLASAFTALLAIGVALALTRSIVEPLKALYKGTEIIGWGDLDYKVGTDAKDEIGQLSRAFDQMTANLKKTTKSIDADNAPKQQLQASEQQLKATNQRLHHEIAERKRVEEALQVSNGELRDFIHMASHDLREPLRKISSFGQLLKDSLNGKLENEDQESLEFMLEGAERMNQMIEELLAYSRVNEKAVVSETVDLNELVKQLEQLELAALLEETGAIIDIPQPLPKVQADPVLIRQLLQNLIINGIKYRKEAVQPRILIRAEQNAEDAVRIELQDNGIGIEKEHHKHLFKMFIRLHSRQENERPGTGLAMCKKIVDKYGGRIGVESKIGVGSTFWFILPAAKNLEQEQRKLISSVQT